MSQTGLFDLSARQEQLSRKGDPLERLNEVIDWEDFRPLLKKVRPKCRVPRVADRRTTGCCCSRCWRWRACMACQTSNWSTR